MNTYPFGTGETRIGGGELLLAFFEEAFRRRVERLVVLVPYVDDRVFADSTFRALWKRVLAIADSTIVVRTEDAAEVVLRATQCKPFQLNLRVNPRLHAKVFLAWRRGAEIALVGSQNLTGAALHTNKEIGLLIKPAANEAREIVSTLRAAADAVVGIGVPFRMSARALRNAPRSRGDGTPLCSRNAFARAIVGDSAI